MYRLIYKTTAGTPAHTDTNEYSVWRQETPSEEEKALLIEYIANENREVLRTLPQNHPEVLSTDYAKTVAIQYMGNAPEVVYTTKEAKDTTFYSDGTYTIYEGTSHDYNDKYFEFEGPFNSTKKLTINE
jgi:hypothetical protein